MTTLHYRFLFFYGLCFFAFTAAAQQSNLPVKFSTIPESYSGISFSNIIEETPEMFLYKYEYLYIGAGVCIGDINNDGLPDIYFSSTRGYNKLYLNLGNLQFRDITDAAGVNGGEGIKTGVTMVDINNDGYMDIMVNKSGFKDPNLRKKVLYINNKNLTFINRAAAYGLDDASFTIQSYFFDYDKDGDKDVFFANHLDDFSKSMTIPATMVNGKMAFVEDSTTQYVSDRLFENRGGKFVDVTKKAGLITHSFSLSASMFDYNGDGWPDIYVANDFNKPDYLFVNNRNGTFTEKLQSVLNQTSFSSMGSDINDLNNDGLEDIYVVDMAVEDPVRQKQLFALNQNYDKFQLMLKFNLFYQYPKNTLQLNNGNGTYSEIANYAGVAETEWSWGPLIADLDNDGWKDIYIANGLKRDITDWDYKVFVLDSVINTMNSGKSVDLNKWLQSIPTTRIKNCAFRNNGTLKFENCSNSWFDNSPSSSSGAAYADLDNDGDLDLVVNNVDSVAFILKNNTHEQLPESSHYLRFRFFKAPGSFNEVYETKVKLTDANGQIQFQRYNPQRGFLSSMEHILHFGTGKETSIPRVEITFPSQKKIVLENVKADQLLTLYESDATAISSTIAEKKTSLFKEITKENKFRYTQKENDYIDFKREPLIPYKCSRKGPYYAMADVNGDGREDIFIGGAAGVEGQLMIQNTDGSFTSKKQPAFDADKNYEDMADVFFDADGDGDNDLYVVSGGAEFDAGSPLYQDRLYLNDGNGSFTRSMKSLPAENANGSCVTAFDYDGDGDMDLFVGGHVLPGKFPQADKCLLLQNNKGIFTNVTEAQAKDLLNPGIVNQAIWSDIDGDGKNELMITGEWMGPEIFKYQNGSFTKIKNMVRFSIGPSQKDTVVSMDEFRGWWYSMKAEDINNDGKMDIVLGNRGTNSTIKGNFNQPCTVYAKDFDSNGSYDAVLGYYIHGKCYPLFSRDQLIDQMPMMRKKFIRYRDYSGTTLDALFTADQKKNMDVYKTRIFESGVLINEGAGSFRFIPFPEKAQLSNINDLVVDDFDKDGLKDVLICGNSNDAAVMVGNYDATPALLLKGDGKGLFSPVSYTNAGLSITGEVRKIVYVKEKNKPFLIFLKNSATAQIFSWY